MKTLTLLALLLLSGPAAVATHLLGGYVRARSISTTALTYEITVTLYMDGVEGVAATADASELTICFGDGTTQVVSRGSRILTTDRTTSFNTYRTTHTYAGPGVYTVSTSITNRSSVLNLPKVLSDFTLSTILSINSVNNQTPVPSVPASGFRVGINQRAVLSLAAPDADGDSVAYALARPQTSLSSNPLCGQQSISAYQFPNDLTRQGTFTLNARTGELVWNAPTQEGRYAVALTINEYRRGDLVSQTTHEITLLVVDQPGTPGVIPPYEPAGVVNVGSIVTALSDEPNSAQPDTDVQLTVFPNPVDDRLQVVVQTRHPATATIQLLDANGRNLHELRFGRAARRHEQIVSMSSLSPGLYVLSANVGGRLLVRKVVKR